MVQLPSMDIMQFVERYKALRNVQDSHDLLVK
ncbi:unnamed protein product, partial [Diplocarpon coronariae]